MTKTDLSILICPKAKGECNVLAYEALPVGGEVITEQGTLIEQQVW